MKTIARPTSAIKSAIGAALTVFCGLMLWMTPLGDAWVHRSYDFLFPFGSHAITNKVTLILLDNAAYDQFNQSRSQPWDRGLHAQLLNKLADDGCELVVMDTFFRTPRDETKDKALTNAMRRLRHVTLMAEQGEVKHPTVSGVQPILPADMFLQASGTNWGVAWLDPDLDSVVRRHWPFPSPGPYPSMPWIAARLVGAQLDEVSRERWLRYYGQHGAWTEMSYKFALTQPANYFRDQIVFVGNQPATSVPGDEPDEFRTPYTRWTGESSGGVELMVTSFLNLLNNDWLRRPAWGIEGFVIVIVGTLLGAGLCRMSLWKTCATGIAVAVVVALGMILWSHFTNYWLPWLVISGGQVPCACAWAFAIKLHSVSKAIRQKSDSKEAVVILPDVPGYELFDPPFGGGSYGKVWLALNEASQWRAVKAIYRANFGENADPYEREYRGVTKYKSISDQHPGLLRVEFVSEKEAEFFYYVMELGDSLEPDWEKNLSSYKPRDLASERARFKSNRLPARDCIRIGITLADALEFLHQRGLTHRDIKPQNIIFVNGQPKLADLGLIADIRPPGEEGTFVGTPGYMPPPPELPGTPQADIYALGIVLYVLSTGRNAVFFPEIATSLIDGKESDKFFPLNNIILKACQPDPTKRYTTAAEMRSALEQTQSLLKSNV